MQERVMYLCVYIHITVETELEDIHKSDVKKRGRRRGGRKKKNKEKKRERKKGDTTTHLSAKPTSSSDSPDDGNNSTGPSRCGLALFLLRFFNTGILYSPSCNVKEYHVLIHMLKIKILEQLKHTPYRRYIRISIQ
jgi:hypothetical protein